MKPIAPINSLLAENLQTTLKIIKEHLADTDSPIVRNLLLYFHKGLSTNQLPQKAGVNFDVVSIDYSEELTGNYIKL